MVSKNLSTKEPNLALRLRLTGVDQAPEECIKSHLTFSITNKRGAIARHVCVRIQIFNYKPEITDEDNAAINDLGEGVEVLVPPYLFFGSERVVLPDPIDVSEDDLWLMNGTQLFKAIITLKKEDNLPLNINYQITNEKLPVIAGICTVPFETLKGLHGTRLWISALDRREFY